MHMCRHDDGGMDLQALAVETQQAIGNDLPHIRSGQRPRAHAGIQPGVVPFAEPAVVFLPLPVIPGLGIGLTPQGKLLLPCSQLVLGNGVRQPETDPVDGAVQMPMRQVAAGYLEGRIGIRGGKGWGRESTGRNACRTLQRRQARMPVVHWDIDRQECLSHLGCVRFHAVITSLTKAHLTLDRVPGQ